MNSPKGRILCSEDDADTRELVSLLLSDQGFEVVCTESANEAVGLAKTQNFDLYLVDQLVTIRVIGVRITAFIMKVESESLKDHVAALVIRYLARVNCNSPRLIGFTK